ncbi:acyl--CoA ligase [bacterium]|nr:acyl--CoA ligase [bacterium]
MDLSYIEKYPDVPVTLSDQLDRCAKIFPKKKAVIDQFTEFNWEQLRNMVDFLAAQLLAKGVCPGDRIIVGMERRHEIVVAFLAIARVGAISVPFNVKSIPEEQEELLTLVSPVGGLFHRDVSEMLSKQPGEGWRIIVDSEDSASGLNAAATETLANQTINWPKVKKEDLAYLNITSGSTGKPKAAMATFGQ